MNNNIEIKFKADILNPEFSFDNVSSLIEFLKNLKKGEYYINQDIIDCPLTNKVIDMDRAVMNLLKGKVNAK